MQAKDYAQALYGLSKDASGAEASRLIQNLAALLKSRGHERLLPRIVSELEKLSAKATREGLRVSVADERSRKDALHKARTLADERGIAPSSIHVTEDAALVRGYSIEGPDFRYDASAKASLLALYKQLIATV